MRENGFNALKHLGASNVPTTIAGALRFKRKKNLSMQGDSVNGALTHRATTQATIEAQISPATTKAGFLARKPCLPCDGPVIA